MTPTTNEQKPQVRARVNVGFTASGKYTWEATIEYVNVAEDIPGEDGEANYVLRFDQAREVALAQSDKLVSELEKRYGPKAQDVHQALQDSLNAAGATGRVAP